MNYAKRDFLVGKRVAPDLSQASLRKSKWKISYRAVAPIAIVIDALIIILTSLVSGIVYHLETFGRAGDIPQYAGSATLVAALFITLVRGSNFYDPPQLLNLKTQIY